MIRHREAIIDFDHAAETAALRAGAERRVEGKQRRRRRAEGAAGFRRMQAARVVAELREILVLLLAEEVDLAFPEMHRGLDRLEEAGFFGRVQRHAILRDEKV